MFYRIKVLPKSNTRYTFNINRRLNYSSSQTHEVSASELINSNIKNNTNNNSNHSNYLIKNNHSNTSNLLKDEIFIPSPHIISLVFQLKNSIPKIENNDDLILETIKPLVTELQNACNSNEKFLKLIYKIEPILMEFLLKMKNISKFVDLFVSLSLLGIKFNNNQLNLEIFNLLKDKNVDLIEKIKLITCNLNIDKSSNMIDLLKSELSSNQKKIIENSYSKSLIKLIIISVYLPLKDISKIDEYLQFLIDKDGETSKHLKAFTNFKTFVNFNLSINKLDFDFDKTTTISDIFTRLTSLLRYDMEIPKFYPIDSFHLNFITEYLSKVNFQTFYSYIKTFYGDKLPAQFKLINDLYKDEDIKIDKELNNVLRHIRLPDDKDIPIEIQSILLDKFISESEFKTNQDLIKEFENLEPQNNDEIELLNNFNFLILKHATDRFNKKSDFLYYLEYIHNSEIRLPNFEKVDILFVFNYYKYEFEKFLNYLDLVNRNNSNYFKFIDSDDLNKILNDLDIVKGEKLKFSILKNNIIPTDNKIIFDWFNEKPNLLNCTITKFNSTLDTDVFKSDNTTQTSLFRALTLLKPAQILDLISIHGSTIHFQNKIFSTFQYYRENFEYICAQLKVLSLKNKNMFETFIKFLKQYNIYDSKKLKEEQKFKLYNIFLENVLTLNSYNGLMVSSYLIPSYKNQIHSLSGINEFPFVDIDKKIILNGNYKLSPSYVKCYIRSYGKTGITNGRLWVTLFKSILNYSSSIENEVEKNDFLAYTFKIFQIVSIKKNFGPVSLCKLYHVAESFNLNPEWKIKVNMSKYIETYYENGNNFTDRTDSVNYVILTVSKYESNIELSSNLVSKLFDNVPKTEKLFFLICLRNIVLTVPFVENIHKFIHEQFINENPEVYKLFGLDHENPTIFNSKSKRAKWMRFDVRYFSPLIEIFMKEIISKENKITITQMMTDSISIMKWSNDNKINLDFLQFLQKVIIFGSPTKSNFINETIQSNGISDLIHEFDITFKNSSIFLPQYLIQPFIFHFLYTRIFQYDLKTIVEMFYILNNGSLDLNQFGFWDIIDLDKANKVKLESEFEYKNVYNIDNELDLMNYYKLIFSLIKNTNKVETNELTYFINISENLIKSDLIHKKNKYWIMNGTFILMSKHSDLLNAFFKKMQTLLVDYKVPNSVISELLYQTMVNNSREIDNILDYMIDSHDNNIMHQSSENVIKRLIEEEQNGLAQLFYAKYTQRKPRFKIASIPETLSWGKAKQPVVTIDSNDAVNMKMDKFKVKLYDYDSLDKTKNQ